MRSRSAPWNVYLERYIAKSTSINRDQSHNLELFLMKNESPWCWLGCGIGSITVISLGFDPNLCYGVDLLAYRIEFARYLTPQFNLFKRSAQDMHFPIRV